MQKTEVIIGSIALVVATVITFGVLKLLSNPSLLTTQKCEDVKYVEVLIAKDDIHLGDPIALSVLDYEKWPQKITKNEFYVKDKITADTFNGYVARRPISAGEPITKKSIVESKNQGALAALLHPGMRAIAINVDAASISGGLVMPGDIVDVVITYTQGTGADQRYISQTALCEVRVLALDQKVTSDIGSPLTDNLIKKDPTSVPRTITLEILPEDVERLTAAVKRGTPSLSLHAVAGGQSKCQVNFSDMPVKPQEDHKDAAQQAAPPPAPKADSVQIIRGSVGDSSSLTSGGKN